MAWKLGRWLATGVMLLSMCGLAAGQAYHNYEELVEEMRRLAEEHPQLVQLRSIGKSVEGRELMLLTIGDRSEGDPDSRPALFLVGNLEGNHVVGSEIALGVARQLVEAFSQTDSVRKLLQERTVYVLPRANPDAAERMFAKVKWEQVENLLPWDDDHDDLTDEDAPEDLNGDGWITQMRVRDPEGEYLPDPKDPRLLVKADPAKGQTGQYKVYTEGLDNDGDEIYNEDGPGGINLDRNFPHAYPYHKPGAGRYQLQAPEARAIVDFMLAHRNVAAVLAYCLHETLAESPQAGQPQGERARAQAGAGQQQSESQSRRRFARRPATSIHEQDLPYFQHASEVFRNVMGIKGKGLVEAARPEGAFFQWAYFHYGVPAFATVGWYPVLERASQAKGDTAQASGRQGTRRFPPGMDRGRSARGEESVESKWLKWFEANTGGAGFVDWKPVDHPQLGQVEIGGFLPFARTNPPDSLLPDLIVGHARFCATLASWLPQIEVLSADVKKLGSGAYELTVKVRNRGYFPTVLAHAERARAVKPTRVEITTEAELLSGRKIAFLDPIPGSGGVAEARWILRGKVGQTVRIVVVSEKGGVIEKRVKL